MRKDEARRRQAVGVESLDQRLEVVAVGSQAVQLIVTNVPGIMMPRYVAGARIVAGYPFAPLAPQCPVSIALYGYDGRLFIGVDADGTAMGDVETFAEDLRGAFEELIALACGEQKQG